MLPTVEPSAGALLWLAAAASPQFSVRPIMFRVVKVRPAEFAGDPWRWLHGYELDAYGDAVEARDVYVLLAGLVALDVAAIAPRPARRRPARAAA